MYNKYHGTWELKILMTSFDYFKCKNKNILNLNLNLNLHDNILKFKIHFELKLILIQWLDEKIG